VVVVVLLVDGFGKDGIDWILERFGREAIGEAVSVSDTPSEKETLVGPWYASFLLRVIYRSCFCTVLVFVRWAGVAVISSLFSAVSPKVEGTYQR